MPSATQNPNVREKLGPPTYLETLLADIGAGHGKVNEALASFLTLPYVNSIKVADRSGVEVSVYDRVRDLQGKYEKLQARTVPITQELSAYSRLSELLLPIVAKDDGLTLDEFLSTNTPLVLKYGKEAKSLARDTSALKDEFKEMLELLEDNLAEVLKRIKEQEHTLEEAEKEYEFEKVTAIISGIITLGFIIGAGVALCLGNVPVAAELAVHGGLALYETIKAAIKAVGLARVISNLKAAIETSKATKKNLEVLIPAFKDIIEMLEKIGAAWDDIQMGLADVKDNYLTWDTPKLFTSEAIQNTLDAWGRLRRAVELYISVITGANATVSALETDKLMAFALEGSEIEQAADHPPDCASLKAIAPALSLAQYGASSQAVRSIFEAPTIRGPLTQPWELAQLVANYDSIARELSEFGQNDAAQQCEAMSTYMGAFVLPAVTTAARQLSEFVARQPKIPDASISERDWNIFCTQRISSLVQGLGSVQAANGNIHNLNFQANNCNNNLTARIRELHITFDRIEQNMTRATNERAEAERTLMIFPFALQVKKIIEAISYKLRALEMERSEVQTQIMHYDKVIRVVDHIRVQLQGWACVAENLEGVYSDLLAGMESATAVWPVLRTLNLQQGDIQVYRATWAVISSALGNW